MKKRNFILVIIVGIICLAMGIKLALNKKAIDAANHVTDRSKIPVTVTVFETQENPMNATVVLPAQLNPIDDAGISVQTAGIIDSLSIDVGSQVRKGEIIGTVNAQTTRINLEKAQLSYQKLKDDYLRTKDLLSGNATTEAQYKADKYNYENAAAQIKLLQQEITNAQIVSPVTGTITTRNLRSGEFANPGAIIARVMNISQLKATVFVDESEVYHIHKNDTVTVRSPLFPGQVFNGHITYLSPGGDENHNYQVDVLLSNNNHTLRAGTNASVTLRLEHKKQVLTIPSMALLTDRTFPTVYVVKDDHVHERRLLTGTVTENNIEVVKGLRPGEQVVTTGQINLTEDALVAVVNH